MFVINPVRNESDVDFITNCATEYYLVQQYPTLLIHKVDHQLLLVFCMSLQLLDHIPKNEMKLYENILKNRDVQME